MAEPDKAAPEPPEPTGEDAQWAALAKELDETPGDAPEGEPEPQPEPKTAEPRPKPSYEELETQGRRTAAALREARESARQSNERLNGITGLIEQLRAGKQPDAPPKEEPKQPTVEDDPIGYFQAELAKRDQVIQQLQQGTKQSTEQVTQHLQEQQFWAHVERSEVEMRKTAPDYDEACQHLETARVAELEVMFPDDSPRAQAFARQSGMQSPEQLRIAMLNRDRVAVAQQAIQLGMSPADLYYRLAKQRGFAGVVVPGGLGKLNGKAPAGKPNPIEAARRGQKAAKSISGGEGGKADNPLSIAELADLYSEDPEEADKMFDKMAKAGLLG